MPKTKRGHSHSSNNHRHRHRDRHREWDETRCPVCMEHPHNAVLLLCSSLDKGCHPYMCNTSHRHSNCLSQFCKAFAETPESQTHRDVETSGDAQVLVRDHAPPNDDKKDLKLVCPLCRGQVNGWVVVEPARSYMNAKLRSCASETCDFSGAYSDLRKHARIEHPTVRPSQADPERQREWRRMEQAQNVRDVLSTIEPLLAAAENTDQASSNYFRLSIQFELQHWDSRSESHPRRLLYLLDELLRLILDLHQDNAIHTTDSNVDALEDDLLEAASSPEHSPQSRDQP